MWSLHASAGHNAAILGVGHFTIPADVAREGRDGHPSTSGNATQSSSIVRNIVVPHDIIAVPRRSPIKARKRTPWDPAKTPAAVERGGTREWFAGRLFVESRQANLPASCSTSLIVHAVALVMAAGLVLAARAARPDPLPRRVVEVSLRMPLLDPVLPIAATPPPQRREVTPALPNVSAPPIGRALPASTVAPIEAPSGVQPEPATMDEAKVDSAIADGAVTGVTGGVPGGAGTASAAVPADPPAVAGPFRVGGGIDRPRKVKHVKPVYPVPAMSARVGGNVLIEATIGVDGKVHNARVMQSIPLLDQAALDAVRQWEFEPSRVDGAAVAVTMVIVVTFALL